MMQIDYSQFLNERRAQKSQQEIAGKGTGARLPSCRIIAFVVPTARPGKECLCLRVDFATANASLNLHDWRNSETHGSTRWRGEKKKNSITAKNYQTIMSFVDLYYHDVYLF